MYIKLKGSMDMQQLKSKSVYKYSLLNFRRLLYDIYKMCKRNFTKILLLFHKSCCEIEAKFLSFSFSETYLDK